MSLTDSEVLELHELGSAVVDGSVTEAGRARLADWLARSADARRTYVRLMAQSASLHHYAAEMQADPPSGREPVRRRVATRWLVSAGALVCAALVAPALVAHFGTPRTPARVVTTDGSTAASSNAGGTELSPAVETHEPVARLSGLKNCSWRGSASLQSGDEIARDSHLQLLAGLAEITFDSGARLILEGPASLVVRSAWEAELLQGALKAQVPREAIGFRVLNRAVNVVDLGTEFTLSTEGGDEAEVLVLKGSVEAQATAGASERVLLSENQGRRFTPSGISEITLREQKLAKWRRRVLLDRADEPLSMARWPSIASGIQGGSPPASHAVLPLAMAWSHPAVPLPGGSEEPFTSNVREQEALQLDGKSGFAAVLPEFSNANAPRTLAFWLRVPEDASPQDAGPIAIWSSPHAVRTEVTWNAEPAEGPYGALRINAGSGGYAIASTPLRDGRWHHVAVSFQHSPRANGLERLLLTLYLDGRLELLGSQHGLRHAAPETLVKNGTLCLGRDLSSAGGVAGFRGGLGELVLTDRLLLPGEVSHLMRKNRLEAGGRDSY